MVLLLHHMKYAIKKLYPYLHFKNTHVLCVSTQKFLENLPNQISWKTLNIAYKMIQLNKIHVFL